MRNPPLTILFLFTFFVFTTKTIFAQETAQNWTKTDCANKEHQLFSELESGKVIVLIYIALTSNTSYVAVKEINKLIAPYASSHPGRVEIYVMGYKDAYTCENMNEWMSINKFTNTTFAGHNEGIKYYGFNESTVAVLGGPEHKVLYKKIDFTAAENTKVTEAINYGLTLHTTAIKDILTDPEENFQVRVYPNPANDLLNISIDIDEKLFAGQSAQLVITDVTGKQLKHTFFKNINTVTQINIGDLPVGVYSIQLNSTEGTINQKAVIQRP